VLGFASSTQPTKLLLIMITLEKTFIHCIDSPSQLEEICAPIIRVSGWIVSEQGTVVDHLMVWDKAHSVGNALSCVPRPDVEAVYVGKQVIGFQGDVNVLTLSDDSMLSVYFSLDGIPQKLPVPLRFAPHFKQIGQQKFKKLKRIRDILCCPACGSEVLLSQVSQLVCPACQTCFPFDEGKYDFLTADLREYASVQETENVSSNNYDPFALAIIDEFKDGLILDNGCGLRSVYYDNVVNFEIAGYSTTDVLGVGEKLPFKSNSFDAVFSLAVLEHVKNPFECAREIVRVLKPGGKLYCVVPFLQPFHGYPNHYYNMTSSGLLNLFEDALTVVECGVPKSGLPIWSLSWFLHSYLQGLPEVTRQQFATMTVAELANFSINVLEQGFVRELSAEANRELASTNYIFAVKPDG
jgi:SAM-dependent methyltransferase